MIIPIELREKINNLKFPSINKDSANYAHDTGHNDTVSLAYGYFRVSSLEKFLNSVRETASGECTTVSDKQYWLGAKVAHLSISKLLNEATGKVEIEETLRTSINSLYRDQKGKPERYIKGYDRVTCNTFICYHLLDLKEYVEEEMNKLEEVRRTIQSSAGPYAEPSDYWYGSLTAITDISGLIDEAEIKTYVDRMECTV